MAKFYFTFGFNQVNQGKFFIVETTSQDLARKRMFDLFGQEWSMEYTEEEWNQDGETLDKIYGWEELK